MSTCKHKWSGPSVLYSESGKRIDLYTYVKWASITDDSYRVQLIETHHENIGDPIISVVSTCSKCKEEFNPFKDTPF